MKKVFDFINSLSQEFFKLFGYPTIKMDSDSFEVYFDFDCTINNWNLLNYESDEFRMFPNDGRITVVYVFYNLPFEE